MALGNPGFPGKGPQDNVIETSDPERLVKDPKVSVLMITYNHVDYLAEAVEGVVQQECDFEFELIIGEDASTDATREIALDYQTRYPEIIRVVHSVGNVGMSANSRRIFKKARGEYVAYCEGDDFWCACDKLARQVALMESDSNIGIVHTDWTRSTIQQGSWKYDLHKSVHRRVSQKYLAGRVFRTWYFPKILRTCTNLLRRDTIQDFWDSGLRDSKYLFGDSVLSAWVTSRFKVGYIPAVTAVYRVSPNSALRSGAASRVAFYRSALEFDTAARAFFRSGGGYPAGYRWESAVGLCMWAMRAKDLRAVAQALLDLRAHFTFSTFVSTGLQVIAMRVPSLKRQRREEGRVETNGAAG